MRSIPELFDILKEWDLAEEAIKISEQITGEVAIPSIMELRYAGRRLGDAFQALEGTSNEQKAKEYLADARFNCLRAQHDAIDISVNYIASFVDEVLLKAEPLAIEDSADEIRRFLDVISSMQKRVTASRSDRSKRREIYLGLGEEIKSLQSDFNAFKKLMVHLLERSDEYYLSSLDRKGVIENAVSAKKSKQFLQISMAVGALFRAIY